MVCMKKILSILLLIILSNIFIGCGLTTSSSTTTTHQSSPAIQEEFLHMDQVVPEAIIGDYILPPLNNNDITVYYYIDNDPIINSTITYIPHELDFEVTLTVILEIGDYSESKDYSVVMLRDLELYEEYMHEQAFVLISEQIDNELPDTIESDFTLPVINYEGATVTYTVGTSRIFNGRFIFPFPMSATPLILTSTVSYEGESRQYYYSILMKGINQLSLIPTIYITTANNTEITSKEDYIQATYTMVTYDDNLNPNVVMQNVPIQIRLRGNSTLWMPKKSFRIKFSEKQSLLFDYEEKDWVLLANFSDQTLIRNYLAYNFAASLNMEFSPSAAFVDVYLNGSYIGNYTLSDQVEVSNDRVDIEEDSSEMDTGYLLEMDMRQFEYPEGTEGVDWFVVYDVPYVIKSPKTDGEFYNHDQFLYIRSYITLVQNKLRNHEDYTTVIDEASFIDWFIVEELFKNVDSGYSSVYMYKDKGGLLKMGPVWDFDLSTSNPGHLDSSLRGPEGWYTSLPYKNAWYYFLMQNDMFKEALKERWNEIYDHQIQDLINNVYPAADSIAKSQHQNFIRWDIIGSNYEWYTSIEVYNAKTYEEQVKIVYDYLYIRSIWMNTEINNF